MIHKYKRDRFVPEYVGAKRSLDFRIVEEMEQIIDVTLAGLTFSCALRFPESAVFPPPDLNAPKAGDDAVCLSQEDWDYYCGLGSVPSAQSEFSLLTAPFSDALMDFDRLILHGVALRWRDKAWLICGISGVGKSTQARCLQTLRPGEFSVICGDRPILEFRHYERSEAESKNSSPVCHIESSKESAPPVAAHSVRHDFVMTGKDEIIVHPSPWNGKENWHGADAAPLAGVILLERGEENRLDVMTEREAAVSIYIQVIQTTALEKRICQSAALITRLLKTVPVWRLTTHQVPDSTKLLLETVLS